jgi:hypothetical protein
MSTDERGTASEQAVLDLSGVRDREELAAITRITDVGAVVVRQSLAGTYAGIASSNVGATVFVPDDAKVRLHVGSLVVGGGGLGAADEVLVVVGALIIISPVEGDVPSRISVVGSVIAPRGSEATLGRVLAGGTGSVDYYRYAARQQVRPLIGQVQLSGAMLVNAAGEPDDILVVAGQVIVTGPISTVGYRQVFVAGQFIAPQAGRAELEARLQAQGQVVWYQSEDPRVFLGDTELGEGYFRLLDHPVSLVVLGDLTISPGVTPQLVHDKVTDIALFGDATAPADVVPVLQLLTAAFAGQIRTADGPQH